MIIKFNGKFKISVFAQYYPPLMDDQTKWNTHILFSNFIQINLHSKLIPLKFLHPLLIHLLHFK